MALADVGIGTQMKPSKQPGSITMPINRKDYRKEELIGTGYLVTCDRAAKSWDLELPWPGKALSPNARVHWAVLAKAKKGYRARCKAIGMQSGLGALAGHGGPVAVHLRFFPPDRRARDWDNLVASMKAGLDGLADAMGVDDSRWRLSFELDPEPVPGGVVAVSVETQA